MSGVGSGHHVWVRGSGWWSAGRGAVSPEALPAFCVEVLPSAGAGNRDGIPGLRKGFQSSGLLGV